MRDTQRRQAHRGLKRLQARFSPTAVFDTNVPTLIFPNPTPDTTTAAVVTPGKQTTIIAIIFPSLSRACSTF